MYPSYKKRNETHLFARESLYIYYIGQNFTGVVFTTIFILCPGHATVKHIQLGVHSGVGDARLPSTEQHGSISAPVIPQSPKKANAGSLEASLRSSSPSLRSDTGMEAMTNGVAAPVQAAQQRAAMLLRQRSQREMEDVRSALARGI